MGRNKTNVSRRTTQTSRKVRLTIIIRNVMTSQEHSPLVRGYSSSSENQNSNSEVRIFKCGFIFAQNHCKFGQSDPIASYILKL